MCAPSCPWPDPQPGLWSLQGPPHLGNTLRGMFMGRCARECAHTRTHAHTLSPLPTPSVGIYYLQCFHVLKLLLFFYFLAERRRGLGILSVHRSPRPHPLDQLSSARPSGAGRGWTARWQSPAAFGAKPTLATVTVAARMSFVPPWGRGRRGPSPPPALRPQWKLPSGPGVRPSPEAGPSRAGSPAPPRGRRRHGSWGGACGQVGEGRGAVRRPELGRGRIASTTTEHGLGLWGH